MAEFAISASVLAVEHRPKSGESSLETVMPVDSTLSLKGLTGTITVSALDPTRRRYIWDHTSIVVDLTPRPFRFYGKLDIYLAGSGQTLGSNIDAPIEEYQNYYHTQSRMQADLLSANDFYNSETDKSQIPGPLVWNSTGLAVDLDVRKIQRGPLLYTLLDFRVEQLCLNGEKPKKLMGASPIFLKNALTNKKIESLPCHKVGPDDFVDTSKQTHPEQYGNH